MVGGVGGTAGRVRLVTGCSIGFGCDGGGGGGGADAAGGGGGGGGGGAAEEAAGGREDMEEGGTNGFFLLSLGLVGKPLAKSPPIPLPPDILGALLTELDGDRESLPVGTPPEPLPTTFPTEGADRSLV